MTTQISSKDWEMLSAYLDGQLSERERASLAHRMEAQPELQRALEDLRQTQFMLRSAPRRRAPRNFTLTSAMVPARRKSWFGLVPSLGFASAFATMLLIFTLALEFLPGLSPLRMATNASEAAPQAVPQASALPSSSNAQDSQVAPTAAPVIIWGGSGLGGGGNGGAGGAGGGSGEAIGLGGGPVEPTLVGPALPPEVQPTETASQLENSTTQPDLTAAAPAPGDKFGLQPSPEGGPILGIRPTEDQGKMTVGQPSGQADTQVTPTAAPRSLLPLDVHNLFGLQAVLVVVALGAAAAAFLLNRKH